MKIKITESQFNKLYENELAIDARIKSICDVLSSRNLPLTIDNVIIASLFSTGGTLGAHEDRIQQIINSYNELYEGVMSSLSSVNNGKGAVTMKTDSNPQDIKKMTDKGLNVSLIDEKLGEEQEITYRHKFEGKKLNVYVTKEKSKVEDIMEYIYSIKDQSKVETCFEKGNVHLFIKDAASGRYNEMDKKLDHKYYKNISGFKNFGKKSSQPENGKGEIVEPTTPLSDVK